MSLGLPKVNLVTSQLVMLFDKKKVEIRFEFRLARDKDQKDVMVSNISDAGDKSQENFSRFFDGILQHQVLAYRFALVHVQVNSFTIDSSKGSAAARCSKADLNFQQSSSPADIIKV